MIHKHPKPDLALLRIRLFYDPLSGVFTWNNYGPRKGRPAGRINPVTGYHSIGFAGKQHQAHRLAWYYIYGEWPPNDIDHVDGIKTNNWLANLRKATRSQNLGNRKKHRKKQLPLGVHQSKNGRQYYALISVNGKNKFLGGYLTKEEAAAAYKEASLRLRCEFSPFGR